MGLAYSIRRILMGGTIEGEVERVINGEETDQRIIAEIKRWAKQGTPERHDYKDYSDSAFERIVASYKKARDYFNIKKDNP